MATKIFLTTTSTGLTYNWSTDDNWNPGGSPVTNDFATLASGGGNQATYTALDDIANLTINDLFVQDSGVTLEIGSGDLLTAQGQLQNAGEIDVFGTFTVQNMNSNTGTIDAETGGLVILQNVSGGAFTINGGEMRIAASGNINGEPTFFLQSGLLDSLSNTPGQADVDFTGSAAGHLAINTVINGSPSNNSLINLGAGDSIEYNDTDITAVSYDDSTGTLTLTVTGGATHNVHITSFAPGAPHDFVMGIDPITGKNDAEVVCFLQGTRIRTPDGNRPVELLLIGDKVLTPDGQARAVRWIWRQTVVTRFANECGRIRSGSRRERSTRTCRSEIC